MVKSVVRSLVLILVWIMAAHFLWLFVGNLSAPDRCIDFGGSFDYRAWKCSTDVNHEYIDTAFYQAPGFGRAAVALVIAIIVSAALRLTRRLTLTRKRAG
jgi:hypothetical protein